MSITVNSLEQSGIKGMHWGVKNGPPYPVGSSIKSKQSKKLLKKARSSNIGQWGKSRDTNICFITGFPGSGKSTLARAISDENTNVIHLDLFFKRGLSSIDDETRDPDFMQFLGRNKILIPSEFSKRLITVRKSLSEFDKAIDEFGKEQYDKKKKVVVEGVELLGNITFPDKAYFSDKPILVLGTNRITAIDRALRRDRGINLIQLLAEPKMFYTYFSTYDYASHAIKEIDKAAQTKRGRKEIDDLLRRIGKMSSN